MVINPFCQDDEHPSDQAGGPLSRAQSHHSGLESQYALPRSDGIPSRQDSTRSRGMVLVGSGIVEEGPFDYPAFTLA